MRTPNAYRVTPSIIAKSFTQLDDGSGASPLRHRRQRPIGGRGVQGGDTPCQDGQERLRDRDLMGDLPRVEHREAAAKSTAIMGTTGRLPREPEAHANCQR